METRQLDTLRPGEEGVVVRVDAPRGLRHRLVEMGLVPGTTVAVAGAAPLGDPIEVALRGYRLAIRRSEAARVTLTAVGPVREPEPVIPLRVGGGEGPGADGPRRRRRWRRPRMYGPGMSRRTPARCHGTAAARPAGLAAAGSARPSVADHAGRRHRRLHRRHRHRRGQEEEEEQGQGRRRRLLGHEHEHDDHRASTRVRASRARRHAAPQALKKPQHEVPDRRSKSDGGIAADPPETAARSRPAVSVFVHECPRVARPIA